RPSNIETMFGSSSAWSTSHSLMPVTSALSTMRGLPSIHPRGCFIWSGGATFLSAGSLAVQADGADAHCCPDWRSRQVAAGTVEFTRSLPVRDDFAAVLDDALYRPLPAGWLIALTDVVDSRGAIAAGRYKAVNVAGVAMITAVMNALATQ